MGDNLEPVFLGVGRTAVAVEAEGDRTCALLDSGTLFLFFFFTKNYFVNTNHFDFSVLARIYSGVALVLNETITSNVATDVISEACIILFLG